MNLLLADEPVFGCTVEQLTTREGGIVPQFVEKCIEVIESKEENLKTDGIYRASGNLSQVQTIRYQVCTVILKLRLPNIHLARFC